MEKAFRVLAKMEKGKESLLLKRTYLSLSSSATARVSDWIDSQGVYSNMANSSIRRIFPSIHGSAKTFSCCVVNVHDRMTATVEF